MNAAGIDMQVLSLTTPGPQNLEPADAIVLQGEVNDLLAETVRARPDRFQAFATLAAPAPEAAAAAALDRAVTRLGLAGAMVFDRTRERHLDEPEFRPLLETAAARRAPLYLHPRSPPTGVREAYYGCRAWRCVCGCMPGWTRSRSTRAMPDHHNSGLDQVPVRPAHRVPRVAELRHQGRLAR